MHSTNISTFPPKLISITISMCLYLKSIRYDNDVQENLGFNTQYYEHCEHASRITRCHPGLKLLLPVSIAPLLIAPLLIAPLLIAPLSVTYC